MPCAVTEIPTASAHARDGEPSAQIGDVHKIIKFLCVGA